MTDTLLVRADGGAKVGAGHLMRCLAIAQAWQERGGRVVFVVPTAAEPFRARIEGEGIAVHAVEAEDAARTLAIATGEGARHAVVDGYCFDSVYVAALLRAPLDVLVIDDNGDYDAYPSRLVLNPNVHARSELYRGRTEGLLLGPRFAPLRRELRFHQPRREQVRPTAARLLVTLGGSDPDGVTSAVLAAIDTLPAARDVEVRVIVGPAFAHLDALDATLASLTRPPVVIRGARDMSEHYLWADACVSGSGSTCWELLTFGVPALPVVLAENQRGVGEELSARGAALVADGGAVQGDPSMLHPLLETLLFDADARARLFERGRALVDGEGAGRVAAALSGRPLFLRGAREDDARALFGIANDPEVRAVSLSTDVIEWDIHVAWLGARLADPDTHFFIAEGDAGELLGYVRFSRDGATAEISVALAAAARGRGFGAEIVRQGVATLALLDRRVERVGALILRENLASIRAFERAGFAAESADAVCGGRPALRFGRDV